ncbi:universal stress protein [Cyanothece sp. BG0011]|uniref:universal stress protein n=1 Tax=Cyanothece sp. BG0011 TaxID=2082950 RepID=UPI000D1E1B40|nr:universal stress protein [Cyanothece sp. BG0011]
MKYNKILVALDNSPLGKKVFEEALSMAKYHQATLKLFHCLPLETPSTAPYTSLYEGEFNDFSYLMRERLETQANETETWLRNYGEMAKRQGITAEWDWKIGEPGRWIRDMAKDWQADLIVVGRRGLTGVSEMLLGSVSNYIVHHAPSSVLVVQETKVN